MSDPGHWRYETSGVLRPIVAKYLNGHDLTREEIPVMRAYLRQWIAGPHWYGVEDLRARVDDIQTNATLRAWLGTAEALGIDPL